MGGCGVARDIREWGIFPHGPLIVGGGYSPMAPLIGGYSPMARLIGGYSPLIWRYFDEILVILLIFW